MTIKHIRNSVIVIGVPGGLDGALAEAVKSFDLAGKTPVDCMDFLRKLKSLVK